MTCASRWLKHEHESYIAISTSPSGDKSIGIAVHTTSFAMTQHLVIRSESGESNGWIRVCDESSCEWSGFEWLDEATVVVEYSHTAGERRPPPTVRLTDPAVLIRFIEVEDTD